MPGTHTKAQADQFSKIELSANYGWAGHTFAAYVVANYAAVKQLILDVTRLVDQQGQIASAERFWSAIIASNIAGAIVARRLGLIDGFPVEADAKWAVAQLLEIRRTMREHIASPKETLSEYLESKVSETLVVSQLANANIAPRLDQVPRGALTIRHEKDTGHIYILRSAFRAWCNETGAHFSEIQEALERDGVLLHRNTQKVLGAGTDFGKGQVRCWLISVPKLES